MFEFKLKVYNGIMGGSIYVHVRLSWATGRQRKSARLNFGQNQVNPFGMLRKVTGNHLQQNSFPCTKMHTNKNAGKRCYVEVGTLRSATQQRATEVEGRAAAWSSHLGCSVQGTSIQSYNEGSMPNPEGSVGLEGTRKKGGSNLKALSLYSTPSTIRVGAWNARTMLRKGKLENVKLEMRRMGLNILGLSEVRWKEGGDFVSDGVRVMYSGGKESQRGVAVIVDNETAKRVTKVIQHSDRMMLVRIQAEPVDIVVIQVYMPTSEYEDEEIEGMYLEELIEKEKGTDHLLILGDFNAVVGEGRDEKEVGGYGVGKRNDRGQMLVEFCRRRSMMVTNMWYEHDKRRR